MCPFMATLLCIDVSIGGTDTSSLKHLADQVIQVGRGHALTIHATCQKWGGAMSQTRTVGSLLVSPQSRSLSHVLMNPLGACCCLCAVQRHCVVQA
jgi:hypothetical protein